MDLLSISFQGILGGAAAGGAVALASYKWLGDLVAKRILEKVEQGNRKELEAVRAKYAQELALYTNALQQSSNRLQAEVDHSIFVTRAHFETEFAAYKESFESLAQVRLAFNSIRPMMSIEPVGITPEQKKRNLAERLDVLIAAQNKAVSVIENLRPFYPGGIYSQMMECLKVSALQIVDVRTGGDRTFAFDWYEEGARRQDQFDTAYSTVAEAIRERLARLAIRPSSA